MLPQGTLLEIWTDGATMPNPGRGGWAWCTEDGRQNSGGDPQTTNQRMELMGPINALETIEHNGPIVIVSDSQYVVKGASEWIKGWKRNGWKNSQKEPVKNRELWERLDALIQKRPVKFRWVRGHNGTPLNEKADQLAQAATGLTPEQIQKYRRMFHGPSA